MAMAEGEAAARLRSSEHERVRSELEMRGFAVCRSMLPLSSIARARQHLEKAVDRHLQQAAARGDVPHSFAGLSLEERIAAAYRTSPEQAPTSWVAETRTSLAFQGMLFRDAQLCALVETLTSRPPVVASRYNVRSKLPGSTNANFPWHQDHAFFRMQYLLKKQAAKRLLAAWAPLVAVSEANGAVELAAGSHTRGFAKHTRSGAFMAAEEPPSSALERVVPSLNPGDVLLFTDLTLHRSGPNLLPTVRWSADWAYELDPSDSICPPLAVHLLRNEQATEEQAPLQLRNARSRLLLAACAALVTTSVAMLLHKRIRR